MKHYPVYILENQSRLLKLLQKNDGVDLPLMATLVTLQNAMLAHPEKTLMPMLTHFNIDEHAFSEASSIIRQSVDDGQLNLLYAVVPLFICQDLEKVLRCMRSPDSSFDNKPEDIEALIHAFKTLDKSSDTFRKGLSRLDQYTRSFLSDATLLYLNEIAK